MTEATRLLDDQVSTYHSFETMHEVEPFSASHIFCFKETFFQHVLHNNMGVDILIQLFSFQCLSSQIDMSRKIFISLVCKGCHGIVGDSYWEPVNARFTLKFIFNDGIKENLFNISMYHT